MLNVVMERFVSHAKTPKVRARTDMHLYLHVHIHVWTFSCVLNRCFIKVKVGWLCLTYKNMGCSINQINELFAFSLFGLKLTVLVWSTEMEPWHASDSKWVARLMWLLCIYWNFRVLDNIKLFYELCWNWIVSSICFSSVIVLLVYYL